MTPAQVLLHDKFLELQQRNSRFTLRAYARKLGLSSGALSEILSGKRPLSAKGAKKIADKLALAPDEELRLSNGRGPARTIYQDLAQDQFHLIADWWHFAILNLVNTKDFCADRTWIAHRLGLSEKLTGEALARLFRLGHLQDESGKWRRKHPRYTTTDEIASLSVRRAHLQDLELIRTSLETIEIEVRDMSSITIAINPGRLGEIKKKIREFQDELVAEFAGKKASEVYRFSSQVFPLTKR